VNDIRLEITTPLVSDWNDRGDQARRDLDGWLGAKEKAREQNQDVAEALIKYIQADVYAAHEAEPI
jgi:hypothetical protein